MNKTLFTIFLNIKFGFYIDYFTLRYALQQKNAIKLCFTKYYI
jgi:hypothetical protein